MSAIPAAVSQVLLARQDATAQQIELAIVGKQLDVQQQVGDSINAMLEQVADVQRQIARGHLDVRV